MLVEVPAMLKLAFSLGVSSRFGALLSQFTFRSKASLFVLPDEILSEIVAELDLHNVLTVRRVCKILGEISHLRMVWLQVFLKRLDTYPRPFFLPKSLKHCTARGLEDAIRSWQAKGPGTIRTQTSAASVLWGGPSQVKESSIHLLPGGRWMIVGCRDGSVWYLDLEKLGNSGEGTPALLTPACPGLLEGFSLAIDYSSPEANPTLLDEFHLASFNLATITSYQDKPNSFYKGVVKVWHIKVTFDDHDGLNAVGLETSECLYSCRDDNAVHTDSPACALYGIQVAYLSYLHPNPASTPSTGAVPDVTIRKWSSPPSSGSISFHEPHYYDFMALMPNQRLLLVSRHVDTFRLISVRYDVPENEKPILEISVVIAPQDMPTPSPIFDIEAIPPPVCFGKDIHLTFTNNYGELYTFRVPSEECMIAPALNRFGCTLIPPAQPAGTRCRAFGYSRFVEFNTPDDVRVGHYTRDEESIQSRIAYSKVDIPPETFGERLADLIRRPFFDQYSNTAVWVNRSLSRICIVRMCSL
ncbi:hypothetical protein D9611_010830 [Ephemerocybe angulata]|uniref:F-box domain-containing protein n=1 Tax=Ephemerocybe angulata TaxID=980116 RepID=A0A8H5FFP2_9AGAR|nr:hypothetical protein D9611_010830 [Tulosesus angulatus]